MEDDGLFGGLRDFFESGTWFVVRNLSIFFVIVFWVATVFWVFKDARRRIEDPWLVATRSSNDRALDEKELGRYAEPYFQHVETVPDPRRALERAQALGPKVLVTGSLYLLADLNPSE